MNKLLYCEILKRIFEHWTPNTWFDNLYSLVYDSDVYPMREFSVVFNKEYKILYIGWNLSEAYWDRIAPKKIEYSKISYIRHINSDKYIFFDENGKNITSNKIFIKTDNMGGEILAQTQDGKWYTITKDGPIPEKEEQNESRK